MLKINFYFLFLSLQIIYGNALKILVISPVFGRSHMQFMGQLADLYAQNGHDVVYFEPVIVDNDPVLNFTASKLARIIHKKKDWESSHAFASFQDEGWSLNSHSISDVFRTLKAFSDGMANSCDSILSDNELLATLKAEKFDIAIAECLTICPYAIYRKIGIKKYITASATLTGASFSGLFGLSAITEVSYVPEFFNSLNSKITFVDRLRNIMSFMVGNLYFQRVFITPTMNVINKHYPDMRIEQMITGSSYVFINSNEHIDFSKAITNKFINIGGIGVPKPKPLSMEYQKLMDNAKNGAVLVSFGSISQSHKMPSEIKRAFLGAFDNFPDIQFIWKYEKSSENIGFGHPNVFIDEWIPQVSLFNHTNLIGFISHGGINSLIEANVFGVPVICIALFGDQIRNCKMMEDRGLSINLQKTALTRESLSDAIHEMVRTKKYLSQARLIGQMLRKLPMSVEERVLKYTQFAVEFDVASNLDIYGRHLSFIKFNNLDVFGALFVVSILSLYLMFKILSFMLRCLCGSKIIKIKSE